jgi:energy-coupling factor transporter ATP-binding protein EcfA2
MIKGIPLIQSIGRFEHATNISFGQLTLIYGSNGRGKSTLTQIFRSLVSKDTKILDARRRFNSNGPSEVVLDVDSEPAPGGPKKRRVIYRCSPKELHDEDTDDEDTDDEDTDDDEKGKDHGLSSCRTSLSTTIFS